MIVQTTPNTTRLIAIEQKKRGEKHLAFSILFCQLLNNLDNSTTVQVLCAVLA